MSTRSGKLQFGSEYFWSNYKLFEDQTHCQVVVLGYFRGEKIVLRNSVCCTAACKYRSKSDRFSRHFGRMAHAGSIGAQRPCSLV